MDIEESEDAVLLDTDMLQLPEVSPFALKSSPNIAEELFSQWLSLPETCRLVYILCDFIEFGFELF